MNKKGTGYTVIRKYVTTVENVDITTGELISNQKVKRDYIVLETITTYKKHEYYTERAIRRHCERSRQTTLF